MKVKVLFFLLLTAHFSIAQIISDDFSDGDLTNAPSWQGNPQDFIVNASTQLQLNYEPAETAETFLYTSFSSTNLDNKEWQFDLSLDFAPSGGNQVQIYLASNQSDLLDNEDVTSTHEGYFLQIGESGSTDAIELYRRSGMNSTLICRGPDGQFGSAFEIRIRVRRDDMGNWEIATSPVDADNFNTIASATDNTFITTSFIGLVCRFTSSRADKFFFDNIYFGDVVTDQTAPIVTSIDTVSTNSLYLLFSEEVLGSTAEDVSNYSLSNDIGSPVSANALQDSVVLTFNEQFVSGTNYALQITNLEDLNENILADTTVNFQYIKVEDATHQDVRITELFPDPTPSRGLPDAEFIELENISNKYFSLTNWTFSDTSTEGLLPHYTLAPGEIIILTASGDKPLFEIEPTILSPSAWPSLNNSGDSLWLRDARGVLIDALAYSDEWYMDEEKGEGGYSLEMINPELSCFDQSNWNASIAEDGGTPGKINAINDRSFQGTAPTLTGLLIKSDKQLLLIFSKRIDTTGLALNSFSISPDILLSNYSYGSTRNELKLNLSEALVENQTYTIELSNVSDCNGNVIEPTSRTFLFDISPPQVQHIFALSNHHLVINFNEPISENSLDADSLLYFPNKSAAQETELLAHSELLVKFDSIIDFNVNQTFILQNLADTLGNKIIGDTIPLMIAPPHYPNFNQLLITEIMAKPLSDQVLPDAEYVELYNPTSDTLSLAGIQFADERDSSTIDIQYIAPDSHVILCPNSSVSDFISYGKTIGVSPWPSLNNTGDVLKITRDRTALIHQVMYDDTWYRSMTKEEEGGWSLEMIDTRNPCEGYSNWSASIAQNKGTPGQTNSIEEPNPDLTGPTLEKAFAPDPDTVIITFNEPLSNKIPALNAILIEPSARIERVIRIENDELALILSTPLITKTTYTVTIENLYDCVGNLIQTGQNSTTFALAELAAQDDIIINELLFNPRSGGVDFIELYNQSEKYINLKRWFIESTSTKVKIFSNQNLIIAPQQFVALTEDKTILFNEYPQANEAGIIEIEALPSFPNDESFARILSSDSTLDEQFTYSEDFHLSYLRSVDGVSLERIQPSAPVDDPNSWISASSAVGYATPGYQNSQFNSAEDKSGRLSVQPKSFAHNTPGRNYTTISYELSSSGNMGTVAIYDINGQLIRTLANNELLGPSGFYRWDGDDAQGRKVSVGYYLIYFEVFHSDGSTSVLKEKVAVATNF